MSDIFLFKAKAVACDSKKLVEGFYVRDNEGAVHGIYSDGKVRPICQLPTPKGAGLQRP